MTKKDFTSILVDVLLNTGSDIIKAIRRSGEDIQVTQFERTLTIALLCSIQNEEKGDFGFTKETISKAAGLLKHVEKKYADFPIDEIIRGMKR